MDSVLRTRASHRFNLVFDDRCSIVRRLAGIVQKWDRHGTFSLVGRNASSESQRRLVEDLNICPWSLLLVREDNERWSGPDAIPIILTNLPFGKIAAVAYIIPGTMWLTQNLYRLASDRRRRFPDVSENTRTAA